VAAPRGQLGLLRQGHEYPAAIELGEQLLSLRDGPGSFLIGVGARFFLAFALAAAGDLRRGVACFRENLPALQGEHRSIRAGTHLNFPLSASAAALVSIRTSS
jgi:hypothetical protein